MAASRCFNPRPRTGGDSLELDVQRALLVSIHAPARGATKIAVRWFASATRPACFNPRPRARGATLTKGRNGLPVEKARVSIHAPARGATRVSRSPVRSRTSFNPRPRTGGDVTVPRGLTYELLFQSTPPHGGRPVGIRLLFEMVPFQSTPPHGGRLAVPRGLTYELLFQSTPPHGGRPERRCNDADADAVSIHAPARGATDPAARLKSGTGVSIHAPARGAT